MRSALYPAASTAAVKDSSAVAISPAENRIGCWPVAAEEQSDECTERSESTRTRKTRTVMLAQWKERGEDGDNIVSQQHPSWRREPCSGRTSITCARRIHAPPIAQKSQREAVRSGGKQTEAEEVSGGEKQSVKESGKREETTRKRDKI